MIIFLFSVAPAIEFCAVPFVWHHATTVGSCFFKSSDNVQQIETYFDIYSCLPVKVIYFSIFFIFLFVFSLENVQLVYKTLKTVFVRFCEHVCVLHHGVVFGLMEHHHHYHSWNAMNRFKLKITREFPSTSNGFKQCICTFLVQFTAIDH
eukprot:45099_1